MRSFALLASILTLSGVAASQTPESPGAFDVADVHASPPRTRDGGMYLHSGRMEMHGVTMLRLITVAYGVTADKVFGGPNWLDSTRFDVIARTSSPLNRTTLLPPLQALLGERFQLKIRFEDKPQPVWALTLGKKLQLQEGAADAAPECKRGNDSGYISVNCVNTSLESLAAQLPGMAPNYFNHPVVDKTGLRGVYNFALKWTGRAGIGAGGDEDHPSISLFDYMDKQLGLKVEARPEPARSVVVEHVNETPSPNPPGTAEKLPPPVTEFEVAEVKPSRLETDVRFDMRNGRITLAGLSMRQLISAAYDREDDEVKGEKWLDSERFDLVAKADPNTTDATLRAMLRTLLSQRFRVAVHEEQQPMPVYALTAPKGQGKLKTTSGDEHAGCTRNPRDGALVYTCRNTTMAQLADRLPAVNGAAGYFDHPMVDFTGLKGSYDFEVTWAPPFRALGRGAQPAGGQPSAVPAASTPTNGITIFEAVEKQLGLKLALEKHPMTVLVVDHAERTPTEQ